MDKIKQLVELFAKYKRDFSFKVYHNSRGKTFMFKEEKEKFLPKYVFITIDEKATLWIK